MDAARFGRALGIGARSTGKALVQAAQAAAASPRTPGGPAARPAGIPVRPPAPIHKAARRALRSEGLREGGRRFGESAWTPFVRLSGVLWLELTGVFFGLFLVTSLSNAWRLRATLPNRAAEPVAFHHLLWSLGMAAVFGYFCLSSFVRARRRERAPHGR